VTGMACGECLHPREPWYHGSPLRLTVLRAASTVTRDRDLARVFSHKPTLVCIEDDGGLKHDGKLPGYLYVVAEEVAEGDVAPHPRSAMAPAREWLTTRPLRLALVEPTEIRADEVLPESEREALLTAHLEAREERVGGC